MTLEIGRPFRNFVTRNTRTLRTVLWDLSTLKQLDTSLGPAGSIGGIAFSHDGTMLAAWNGAFLDVWDLAVSPATSQSFPPQGGVISAVAF
jgi:hypothetical protein